MVTRYGMSELGPVIFGESNEEIFLGKDFGHIKNYSEEIAAKIDNLIKAILEKAHKHAKEIITKHKKLIEQIAENLIQKETINKEEFFKYFTEIDIPKKTTV